jgi:hypothetical protein
MMDLTPLLCVGRVMEQSLLLLIWGLLLAISTISMISMIDCIDLLIILLLLWGPLATWFKESSSGLGGLNAYFSDCKQIGHCFWLLRDNFLNSLDITHPVVKGIDDLDILDVWDSVLGVAEMFYVVSEAFIMLLLDGLLSFRCR